MNHLDTYYRALVDYRKNTTESTQCSTERRTVAKANATQDAITVTAKSCLIKTDWVEAIEAGLVHVDKAIREERQFIRSNGEVIDIEKVKHVSKDSVVHLSQHSNLITRYEEGEDIIPDRLYTVEKLSDFAVYENRFLYMMLCYLRDFVTVRYNKITEYEYTYKAALSLEKSVSLPKRELKLSLSLDEERKDDPYLRERSTSRDIINRIRDVLELSHALLATPLMQEVAKAPMLKPPVTKTNVLRMNHNFRGALALYEYVTAYEGDGFTVTEQTRTITPFRLDTADEMSEVALLASFLTYEYGLDIKESLKLAYQEEEEKRRQDAIRRHAEKLASLRRRIRESGESPEEYMLLLEKQNRALERDREKLAAAEQQITQMQNNIAALEEAKRSLNARLATSERTLQETLVRHEAEVEAMREKHAAACEALTEAHRAETEALLTAHREQTEALTAAHTAALLQKDEAYRALGEAFDAERRTTSEAHVARLAEAEGAWRTRLDALHAEKATVEAARAQLSEALARESAAKDLMSGRFMALSVSSGGEALREDYTDKASFAELERQYEAFGRFFKEEWKKAKASIRKSTFAAFRAAIKSGKSEEFLAAKTPEAALAVQDVAVKPAAEDTVADAADVAVEAISVEDTAVAAPAEADAEVAAEEATPTMTNEEKEEHESKA